MKTDVSKYFEKAEYEAQMSKARASTFAQPFYVGTTLSNAEAARSVADALESTGMWYCTYKWYLVGAVPRTLDIYSTIAEKEMAGVANANFFFGLLPGRLGMAAELGSAIGQEKLIVLYAEMEEYFWEYQGAHPCIFNFHPSVSRVTGPNPSKL